VNEAIRVIVEGLGPDESEEDNPSRREALNSKRRIEKLQSFLNGRVKEFKSNTTTQRIYDMGTVMQLILNKEIGRLQESARRGT
jgi:hypothetical protein